MPRGAWEEGLKGVSLLLSLSNTQSLAWVDIFCLEITAIENMLLTTVGSCKYFMKQGTYSYLIQHYYTKVSLDERTKYKNAFLITKAL